MPTHNNKLTSEQIAKKKKTSKRPDLVGKPRPDLSELLKGNQYATGLHEGRPTKYDESYPDLLISFFSAPFEKEIEVPHYKNGAIHWVDKQYKANLFPTVTKFCRFINICVFTYYKWIKEHKDFSKANDTAKELQKDFLVENTLNGNYNPLFAKFVAINYSNMVDRKTIAGDEDNPIKIDYVSEGKKRAKKWGTGV